MEVFPLHPNPLSRGARERIGATESSAVGLSLNPFPLLVFAQESDSPRKAAKAVSRRLRDSEPDIAHKRRAGKCLA